jgi:arylsulfatase
MAEVLVRSRFDARYPFQEGSSLNAAGISHQTLEAAAALKKLQDLESMSVPVGR